MLFTDDNIENSIKDFEKKLNKKISWYAVCPFYADSKTKKIYNNALFFLTDITFYIYTSEFNENFKALDIYYTDTVLKKDALSFLSDSSDKPEQKHIKRATIFTSLGKEKLLSLELEDKSFRVIDVKILKFKQLLSIAQAKQKYSRRINLDSN